MGLSCICGLRDARCAWGILLACLDEEGRVGVLIMVSSCWTSMSRSIQGMRGLGALCIEPMHLHANMSGIIAGSSRYLCEHTSRLVCILQLLHLQSCVHC